MKRTTHDWFNLLPPDVAEKATNNTMTNRDFTYLNSLRSSMSDALSYCIVWDDTLEKQEYWKSVIDKYGHLDYDTKITIDNLKRIGFKKNTKDFLFLEISGKYDITYFIEKDIFWLNGENNLEPISFDTMFEILKFSSHFKNVDL